MASTYTVQNVRDMVYKLLDEYSTTTASIDSNVTNRIDECINVYYMQLSEKDKTSALTKISQFPVENMLGETFSYDTHTTTAINFSQASSYAYYFEVDNECSVDIKEGSSLSTLTTLSTLTITGISTFTRYRGFMTGAVSGDYYQLSFYGDNVYNIRNVAFYPYTFGNNTASIPDFKPHMEYALSSDYMDTKNVTYRYNEDYGVFTDYRIENGYLLIPRGYSAEFYHNYWKQVSKVTTATNTFDLKDKTCLIIPYGVAGDILIGNGFNVQAGMTLKNTYEQMKAQIDTSNEQGRHTLYNIKQW
jgi:hypothetical protein